MPVRAPHAGMRGAPPDNPKATVNAQDSKTEVSSIEQLLDDTIGLRVARRVCPVCSSNLVYPLVTAEGFICGHCDSMFAAPAPGCPLDDAGLHDETWMNDGLCACGSDGSAEPAGVIE